MQRKDVKQYLIQAKNQRVAKPHDLDLKLAVVGSLDDEVRKELDYLDENLSFKDLSEIEIRNPITILGEVKSNKKARRATKKMGGPI
jgi:hypothetical protein